jgi:LPS-assembly protein
MKNRWVSQFFCVGLLILQFSSHKLFALHTADASANQLNFKADSQSLCRGQYHTIDNTTYSDNGIHLWADNISLIPDGRSLLTGHVAVYDGHKRMHADKIYIYRDEKQSLITKIMLLSRVSYEDDEQLFLADKATFNPQTKAGVVYRAWYRLGRVTQISPLPGRGFSNKIIRYASENLRLLKTTYTTCPPSDDAWAIHASDLHVNTHTDTGVAKNAYLSVKGVPVLYSPYLTFPTSKKRKSGFLLPIMGYSRMGGMDFAIPYYLNLAPNYDLTLTPHWYSQRGLMLGGKARYLTSKTYTTIGGTFLAHDSAFARYINDNLWLYPSLSVEPKNRWSFNFNNSTELRDDLHLNVSYQRVSDDYYLQDFSTNLAVLTNRQLLQQASFTYSPQNWMINGLVQRYQTLNPVNLPILNGVYERLPELSARGLYPLINGWELQLNAQYDEFHWPMPNIPMPEGPRLHLQPNISKRFENDWGFIKPSMNWLSSYYSVAAPNYSNAVHFSPTWLRGSIDSGLYFERNTHIFQRQFTQTFEPRVFYLYNSFREQTNIPVYDSAYMIFNTSQLYRDNRFSGLDRIGDANQITYGFTTRLLDDDNGREKLSFSLGQIHYFNKRRTTLCYDAQGLSCVDAANTIGWLSQTSDESPVASELWLHYTNKLSFISDYVWDPATGKTNNAAVVMHYDNNQNKIYNVGLSYLINGDNTAVANLGPENNSLFQSTLSMTYPINAHYSLFGIHNYNLSKGHTMLSLLGIQYDSCCWAVRVLGGQTFNSLDINGHPGYNNNVYLQVLLKGLGSVASTDPTSTIRTFIPGFNDTFHR